MTPTVKNTVYFAAIKLENSLTCLRDNTRIIWRPGGLWRNFCIMTPHGPWSLRKHFKRGLGDRRKQSICEFNWTVISIEIQFIKFEMNRLKWSCSLFVKNGFKQQLLFTSNLARLSENGTSPSIVIRGHQFYLTNMADGKPIPCIVKWNLFTCYLNSPPFGCAITRGVQFW